MCVCVHALWILYCKVGQIAVQKCFARRNIDVLAALHSKINYDELLVDKLWWIGHELSYLPKLSIAKFYAVWYLVNGTCVCCTERMFCGIIPSNDLKGTKLFSNVTVVEVTGVPWSLLLPYNSKFWWMLILYICYKIFWQMVTLSPCTYKHLNTLIIFIRLNFDGLAGKHQKRQFYHHCMVF